MQMDLEIVSRRHNYYAGMEFVLAWLEIIAMIAKKTVQHFKDIAAVLMILKNNIMFCGMIQAVQQFHQV